MRMRAKALTVAAAMVTTFATLPTFGAAAAEPLDDGSYHVTVGESTWTVEVVDGAPVVEGVEGVEFTFAFDEETGRVLDEFDVAVDGTSYDAAVADDGTVEVVEDATDGGEPEGEGEEQEGDGASEGDGGQLDGVGEELDGDDEVGGDVDTEDEPTDDEPTGDEDDGDDEDVEALQEDEADGEDSEAGGDAHGALVSTVAQCAPRGRQARDAGLPNHGFFVSAAARGETVEFEVDGTTLTADLTTAGGAEEFCNLAAELEDAAGEQGSEEDTERTADEPQDAELEADDADDEPRARGKGRSGDARGRSGDAPGRSGEAPGRAKKDR